MLIKPGVDLRGIRPEMVLAVIAADRIWQEAGYELVITSGRDGRHKPGSLHYSGNGLDFRTLGAGMDKATARALAARLKTALGEQWDVIDEGDHIHVEFDPKGPRAEAVS